MIPEIDYRRVKMYESVTSTHSQISALSGNLWSDLEFVPFVCMENGTAVVKGVVKRADSNVVSKYEEPTVRSVASNIIEGSALDCEKDRSLSVPRTCLFAFGGTAGFPPPSGES